MRAVRRARFLVGLTLLGAAGIALADSPAAATETVVIIEASSNCNGTSVERARTLADKAWHEGAYQRAGECYLAAGEYSLADQAFVKASAQSRGDTSQRLAANLNDVKAQARQLKQVFQRR